MKPTDFSRYVSGFMSRYLPDELGASINTIESYRDMFMLLITFMQSANKVGLNKLTLNMITKTVILEFLDWLKLERGCGDSTRNQRLAAIHSFYSYVQAESLENMYECQKILSIKFKKTSKDTVNYLSIEGVKLLLQQPDTGTRKGRRDLVLLSTIYDSGARVQEAIDMTPSAFKLEKPVTLKIIGKGNKARLVPLMDAQIENLKCYLHENKLDAPFANQFPLFYNSRKEKLTRSGINYIVKKYADLARAENPAIIPVKLSPHSLRHSKAMHLLQAGVNIVYIRDILGHVSIQTTEVYARADSRQKRAAIEKAYINLNPEEEPKWSKDDDLLTWLKAF